MNAQVEAILGWAEQSYLLRAADGAKVERQLVFDTTSAVYFENAKALLGRHGWQVSGFAAVCLLASLRIRFSVYSRNVLVILHVGCDLSCSTSDNTTLFLSLPGVVPVGGLCMHCLVHMSPTAAAGSG